MGKEHISDVGLLSRKSGINIRMIIMNLSIF